MSEPSNDDTMPPGILIHRGVNGSTSGTPPNHKKSPVSDVMGDIGNPPTLSTEPVADKHATHATHATHTTQTNKDTPPSTTSPLNTTDTLEVEELRNCPTPSEDESGDGEQDESPAPSKRASVFNGKEHEGTDDFLLSTMLAIRTAVLAGTRDSTKLEASPEDFTATRKHKISMAGDRKIEVKDYAPVIFTLIRRKFGVSIPSYLLSWSDSRIAKSRSVGKSDSVFIHSPDNKFILKTLGSSEAKRLRKILQPYYEHLTKHKDTFMSRIYGLHRMSRRRGQSNVYFAIFNNVFDSGHSLTEIYDLKGSTVGRRASGEQVPNRRSSTSFDFRTVRKAIAEEPPKKPTVLKDLDFTRKLHVGPENRSKILAQLATDCKFLCHHQLMDYSLLIGIRRLDTTIAPPPTTERSTTPPRSGANTPVTSPSPDGRGLLGPLLAPASPRVRHSFVLPSTVPKYELERVPGLLFFLESTKAASSKSIRESKRDRRKSISKGSGTFLTPAGEDMSSINEEDGEEGEKAGETETTTTTTKEALNGENGHDNEDDKKQTDSSDSISSTESSPVKTTPISSATALHTPPRSVSPVPQSFHDHSHTKPLTNPTNTIDSTNSTNQPGTTTPPPEISVTPASPLPAHQGNSGEVGATTNGVPPLKLPNKTVTTTTTTTTSTTPQQSPLHITQQSPRNSSPPPKDVGLGVEASGNEASDEDEEDDEEDEEFDDSTTDSPRTLGLLTVSSVPNFDYMSGQPPLLPMPKSASSLRFSSAHNSPKLLKRPNRSASLTYVNLDPLCGNPYIPFHKTDGGGMKGNAFVPLDANKCTEIYYIGLIDFLQKFDTKKKFAGVIKSIKYEKEGLSTVDPVFYMERFIKMTEKAIGE